MATCNVRVEITEATIPAGGTVTGHVVVDASDLIDTKGLSLEVGWHTHGRGDRDGEIVHTSVIHKGTLSGQQRIPFSVTLPKGPLTYHGRYINVDWSVTAKLDLAWAADPKHTAHFTLTHGAEPYVAGNRDEVVGKPDNSQHLGCLVLFLMPFLAVGGYLCFTALRGEYFNGFIGAVFIIIPLIMLGMLLAKRMAQNKVGPAEIVLSSLTPRAGDTLQVSFRLTPANTLEVNGITARFHGYERAEHSSGSDRIVDKHTLHDESIVLCAEKRRLGKGEPVAFDGTFTVPKDAPPAFFSVDNDILWVVSVHLDIQAWPDWKDEVKVGVLPKASS